ncbi:DUF6083 domain-containing protein [Streptomyces sp. GLT-R25]
MRSTPLGCSWDTALVAPTTMAWHLARSGPCAPTPPPPADTGTAGPRTTHPRRPLRVAAASPSRLLRAGQSSRCRQCGHRIDLFQRTDQRPIALHPAELATTDVPASCRWHLSSGIAHPHGDGSPWCRIPHAVLCPSRTATTRMSPRIEAMRRQLAVRTRRLIDSGAITPAPPTPCKTPADNGCPDRAVVQLLLGRYLAEGPIDGIRCVAQRHASAAAAPTPSSTPALRPASGRSCPSSRSTANSPCPTP